MKRRVLAMLSAAALAAAPAAAQGDAATPPALTTYRLYGAELLRPVRIGDDGVHTYIQWGEDQPIPAVFALDGSGAEQMVDGYMRGDLFTIDRVFARLVFRIDKLKAEARRQAAGQARR